MYVLRDLSLNIYMPVNSYINQMLTYLTFICLFLFCFVFLLSGGALYSGESELKDPKSDAEV